MQAQNVRDNLTLMSEISKTMPFLQLPIKFSNDKIINSDLYIFNNKKRKSSSPVKSVNAMIKLELENLGGVDIYINIAGKNARARFFSDKNEAVEEITKNLPELNEAVYNLGFNFTSAAESAEKESEFDILDDFINREVPKTEIRKYILRKKI
jgi:flagellar hook-length control protein FliK